MRNRVVELVAIMAIQVALFGHVQVRSPRFGVKNATDLPEIEHSFPYHSHRRGVKQPGYFLTLLEAIAQTKERCVESSRVHSEFGGPIVPKPCVPRKHQP